MGAKWKLPRVAILKFQQWVSDIEKNIKHANFSRMKILFLGQFFLIVKKIFHDLKSL